VRLYPNMSLAPGTRLGAYEVLALLAAGILGRSISSPHRAETQVWYDSAVTQSIREHLMPTFKRGCVVLLLSSASACGGSNSSPSAPSTPSTPCVQTIVFQGSGGSIPASTADFESLTTTATGRVDVTLDWTFSSSLMLLQVAQGACNFDQFKASSCTLLLNLSSPPKPLKGSIQNVAAGTYPLIIGNANSVRESVSVQVVLSTGTCPTASSMSSEGKASATGIHGMLFGILRHLRR
jgi:hypothetical protein